ncbi:MAG TPA: transcriptional repressor LexA [Planctomycetota bacterium]|nr:transcriptional repressor LexA [Planctomycetota bacterium]
MNYTPKQLQILKLIHQFQEEHGYSPTYAELAKQLGVSTITVFEHLEALERKNAIRRRRHEARSVEIIEPNFLREHASKKTLAVKGLIAAGLPIEAVEDAMAEEMPLADVFNCKPNSFMLRVKGDSMVDDHIMDGDLIVVEGRDTANDGEIVVALDDGGQATLKRFYRENGKIRLQPSNPTMPPIIVDNCKIQGVFKGLIRRR